jgi:glyoxalase family protein
MTQQPSQPSPLAGIHHVTAIASDPQRNVDVYAGVLGLRLVKKTVNFDDPGTYHLYYGDDLGRPGSILTFFPWPRARRGTLGSGQTTATAFAVPAGTLDAWEQRLVSGGLWVGERSRRFGEEDVLPFVDPDGLRLELVASERDDPRTGWADGPLPADLAIRGFHQVTLTVTDPAPTLRLLVEAMGMRVVASEGERTRLATGGGLPGALVDVVAAPGMPRGNVAAGSVHHVAWRTDDDQHELAWREHLLAHGQSVTPQLDRNYFRSVYFREPGGVLFELATDPPGFTADEPAASLGSTLRLPPWLESHRREIEGVLPALAAPSGFGADR